MVKKVKKTHMNQLNNYYCNHNKYHNIKNKLNYHHEKKQICNRATQVAQQLQQHQPAMRAAPTGPNQPQTFPANWMFEFRFVLFDIRASPPKT